jgi:hypothetical protein
MSYCYLAFLFRMNPVQQKVSCLFETEVLSESSSKRPQQGFKVVASERLKQSALESHLADSVCSEKIDGTCVYVSMFQDRPWLWARLDRKPTKGVEKKFKKYQQMVKIWEEKKEGTAPDHFQWDAEKDFKEAPVNWIPALGVPLKEGIPQPDEHGHMPGWVPLEISSRQYVWHLGTVHLEAGLCILMELRNNLLEIREAPLERLKESTLELIGTNINANPYKMGSKQSPLHVIVQHGSISFSEPPTPNHKDLTQWLSTDDGAVEGLVWHCSNGRLFKIHRHHLQLPWPIPSPRLTCIPVTINVCLDSYPDATFDDKSLFAKLGRLNGKIFNSICDIQFE